MADVLVLLTEFGELRSKFLARDNLPVPKISETKKTKQKKDKEKRRAVKSRIGTSFQVGKKVSLL